MSVDLLAGFFNPPDILIISLSLSVCLSVCLSRYNGRFFYRSFYRHWIHLILSNKNFLVKYRFPSLIL